MIESRTFRNVLGRLATGVSVIAVAVEDGVHAMTANAVCAVSLEPPQILFCPKKAGRLSALLPQTTRFSVNFLRDDQQALSNFFAGAWKESEPPPFRFVQDQGAPRLQGSLAALICEKQMVHDGGDHWIVVGRVLALHQGVEPHYPLLFFKGKYQNIERRAGKEAPALTDVTDEPPTVFYH